ncbi:MAG: hypothetical protein K5656_08760 [Lachnospiraceae bacterium]|nr:hypothetical protein [Lachnospiraceae bacterium]
MTSDETNKIVMAAAKDADAKNDFLVKEQQHILKATAKIAGKSLTTSDDEWSVGLMAVSEAIDTYDDSKGAGFWSYANIVIRSRLADYYRKSNKEEILVEEEAFTGVANEEAHDAGLRNEIVSKTMVLEDNSIADEISALTMELKEYDISFMDLAGNSPKAGKTKNVCLDILRALFIPPPLVEEIRRTKSLPVKKLADRTRFSRKLTDRYRKYLIVSALILDGDYPELSEYLHEAKSLIKALE